MKQRVAVGILLIVTAALYLWDLSASGYGNTYYAAAAQAGAQSWSAWFFGSLDPQNFITVDKPPASLWVTGLSVRLFGLSSWSVLVPQALMGVAAVAVLYATVRRAITDPQIGCAAGLLAGAVLAVTPAAALMFRFNNPDALLVLLLTVAAYCMTRAVAGTSWRWLTVTGAVVGLAFLTKMLQAFLVLPGFALAYLLLAQVNWQRRILHLASGAAAVVAGAGWWVLIVSLIPPDSRPYIGSSRTNSVLDLAFGYNGIGRIVGQPSAVSATFRSPTSSSGPGRLFSYEMGNEISWLLPAALLALAYGAYLTARARLSRNEQAALLIWGSWLVVTVAVLSYMTGTVHPYYTVALAPAIAALCGLAGLWSWRDRSRLDGRLALVALPTLAGCWSATMVNRNHFGPSWLPWLAVALTAALAVSALRIPMLLTAALALSGSAAFTVATVATPHHGASPSAVVPARVLDAGWLGTTGTEPQLAHLLADTHTQWSAAANGAQAAAALELSSGTAVLAVGGWSGDPAPTLEQFIDYVYSGRISYYVEAGKGGSQTHGKVLRSPSHTAAHTREIADWVAAHYQPVTIGDSLVYRLTGHAAAR
ncbi:4-amino-4-deoxy-L-arabinose transferase-like glycosyltransferase [Mycobacterium sp. MAA66]|uniref:glycosyltransferase family 39 protein n=1 Tax=Mycobacterium sp. MAA66 TaxID=3156297 RepID=UPI003517794F